MTTFPYVPPAASARWANVYRGDRVTIDGVDVTRLPPAVRDVAFVFQQYSLYPHMSVYDNLAFPLRSPARRVPEDEIRTRVNAILTEEI